MGRWWGRESGRDKQKNDSPASWSYESYADAIQKAADLSEAGDHQAAVDEFLRWIDSGISDLDKAMLCQNVAVLEDKMDRTEKALDWYDRGIEYERPHLRFNVEENKAIYLFEKGQREKALEIYRRLHGQPYLNEFEKERMRLNIERLN